MHITVHSIHLLIIPNTPQQRTRSLFLLSTLHEIEESIALHRIACPTTMADPLRSKTPESIIAYWSVIVIFLQAMAIFNLPPLTNKSDTDYFPQTEGKVETMYTVEVSVSVGREREQKTTGGG